MICAFCGNVTENKRAIGMYIRAARITYIDCPECGCALSIKELRAAVRNYNEQFEEKRVRWITIHGRHIPMREKDAAGGGGSAETGLTTAGGSSKIGDIIYNAAGKPVKIVSSNSLYGEPNSITQVVHKKGGIERNYFDDQGKQISQVCNNDHDKPKAHPFGEHGEHGHTYTRDKDGKPVHGEPRELTMQEREENSDIL